jgi:hypothetical protein
MSPIRDGSGNSIGSIRLGDGTEISEVRTGAGDVLFSAAPPIPDTAVHFFQFENNLTDSAGSLGTTNNGTTFETANPLSGTASLRAGGNGDTVDFNSSVSVDATNDIAFTMLVRFDTVTTSSGVFSVDDFGGNGSFDLAVGQSSNQISFNYRNARRNASVTASVNANTTYKVTAQYDHSNAETKIALDSSVKDTNSGQQLDGVTKNVNGLMKTHFTGSNVGTTLDVFAVHDTLLL